MKYISPRIVAAHFVPQAFAGASCLEIALQKITGGFLEHLNVGISDCVQPPSVRKNLINNTTLYFYGRSYAIRKVGSFHIFGAFHEMTYKFLITFSTNFTDDQFYGYTMEIFRSHFENIYGTAFLPCL